MSKAAGTLMTTHKATYTDPRFMPGYKGYVPTMKYEHGHTYGGQTYKYLQDYRSSTLDTSKTRFRNGGYFSSYCSNGGEQCLDARARSRDRMMQEPRISLDTNKGCLGQANCIFSQIATAHREHYNDRSGLSRPINYFNIPKQF